MKPQSRSGSVQKISEHHERMEGIEIKRRKCTFMKEYIIDYTANSNLHGLKYIGEKERTKTEKLFWLLAFICSVVLCSFLIRNVWRKWNDSPVIVSFAENPTPVWQIPYPAVTVCLETKSKVSVFDFTDNYHRYNVSADRGNMTNQEIEYFEDLTLVCDDHLSNSYGRKYGNGSVSIANLKKVAPNLTEAFFGCQWKDVPMKSCENLFSPILTEEGICFTFNTLRADELFKMENLNNDYKYLEHNNKAISWNLEDGYAENTPLETYPNRGSGSGAKSGLVFLMKTRMSDLDYLCRGPVQGFKVLLHNPAELPRLTQSYFRSGLNQELVVAVKPKMMTTSSGLRPYDPERRQCYFPTERYLRFYKVYTQSNCEFECFTNYTYSRCGCVHISMPHDPEMKVCNTGSMTCVKKVQMELVVVEVESYLKKTLDSELTNEARRIAHNCKCLPACTSIEYEAEISKADYDWKDQVFKSDYVGMDDDSQCSRVAVFFKEPQFITSRRSELYGQTDFLANCGGLLGLFMGFSLLSLAEILYFLTLRLVCVLWRRRKVHGNNLPKAIDNFASENEDKVNEVY
ncbi:pickpocket protein 28-like [Amyelois transitella]|uniref:pickpocket protein 28-like n=1 Tax=Amyelois transitella TaxID=680683 RepID=UPI00298FEA89|nr:pickpocket protein 28-like [Amyelois transitella]